MIGGRNDSECARQSAEFRPGLPSNQYDWGMDVKTMRPPGDASTDDEATEITWLGHSTVLIRTGDTWILTDPVLRGRMAHLRRRLRLLPEDWPARVDAILISHLHLDHCDLPTLRRLGRDIPIVAPSGAGGGLQRRVFRQVEELEVGARREIEQVTIAAVPADHSGHRVPFGPTAAAVGYLIEGHHTTYFAGDTDIFEGMATLAPSIDVALIPVWGWGRSLGPGHLEPRSAAEALRIIRPRLAIPIHWGTFHPIGTGIRDRRFLVDPPHRFAEMASETAPDVEVRILPPGGQVVIT